MRNTRSSKKISSGRDWGELWYVLIFLVGVLFLFKFGMPWENVGAGIDWTDLSKGSYPRPRVMIIREGVEVVIQRPAPKGK